LFKVLGLTPKDQPIVAGTTDPGATQ